MARDSYDDDWDELEPEASGAEGGAVSNNSVISILHSVLGGSSDRGSIGSSGSEDSFGGYGDDLLHEGTDFAQDNVEKPPIEEQEEGNLEDHGAGEEIVENEHQTKGSDHLVSTGQTMVHDASDAPYGGDSSEEYQRRSRESIHQGQASGRSYSHVGVGYNDGKSTNTKEAKSEHDSNDVVTSSTHRNGNENKDGNYYYDNGVGGGSGIDNGNGTDRKKDGIAHVDTGDRIEIEPTRWPSRESVESSSGYIFYARIAGDYPDGHIPGPRTPRRQQRRRRRRRQRSRKLRQQTDGMEQWQEFGSLSSHKRAVKNRFNDEAGKEAGCRKRRNKDDWYGRRSSNTCLPPGPNAPTAGRICRGGDIRRDYCCLNSSTGLSGLERDLKGAMVAVWLAWGVRIDAEREKLRREEMWLDAVHRTEIAKVRSNLAREYDERTQHGITTEVLECVVQEAALQEMGESERAKSVREQAMQARISHLSHRKDAVNLRRPILESTLRKSQATELLVVRGKAETFESKLVRARNDTVRLLQLHLSRARRLVSEAAITTESMDRAGSRRSASLVLHGKHLLKLGKILLLAQETANRSIEKALLRRRDASDGATKAGGITAHGVDGKLVCGSGGKNSRASGNTATKRPTVVASCRGKAISHDDGDVLNATSNDYHNRHPRPSGPGRIENTAFAPTTPADNCLWCRPVPAGRPPRYPAAIAADVFPRRERHSVRRADPYGLETAVSTKRQAQPPKPWKQVRTRLKEHPYAPPIFSHRHNQPKMIANRPRLRTPHHEEEVLRCPLLYQGNVCNRTAAIVHVPSTANPAEQPDSSGIDLGEQNDDRLEQGDGSRGYAAPRAFFCSWECAGRWNARFSPVQARHERGLRIDIAAGRVVAR